METLKREAPVTARGAAPKGVEPEVKDEVLLGLLEVLELGHLRGARRGVRRGARRGARRGEGRGEGRGEARGEGKSGV